MLLLAHPLLSRLGGVVVDVETRSFQDKWRGGEHAADTAAAVGTPLEGRLGDSLANLEAAVASGAFVLVRWHGTKRT